MKKPSARTPTRADNRTQNSEQRFASEFGIVDQRQIVGSQGEFFTVAFTLSVGRFTDHDDDGIGILGDNSTCECGDHGGCADSLTDGLENRRAAVRDFSGSPCQLIVHPPHWIPRSSAALPTT